MTDNQETEGTETVEEAPKSEGRSFSQAEVDRIVAERLSKERSKYADYGDLKKKAAAAMSEQERAVSEAEQRGRSAALLAAGERLARAELRAASAGKVSGATLDGFLEYADIKRFVGDDGEPDSKAIQAAIKRLGASGGGTDYDGGARISADQPKDMNALIRQAAGLA